MRGLGQFAIARLGRYREPAVPGLLKNSAASHLTSFAFGWKGDGEIPRPRYWITKNGLLSAICVETKRMSIVNTHSEMTQKTHTAKGPKSEKQPRDVTPQGSGQPVDQDPAANPNSYMEEIHKRAETMSPLLQGILDYRPPLRWGLNE